MGIFSDLGDSASALAALPAMLSDLIYYGAIVFIGVVAFGGIAFGIGEIRSPAQISVSARVPTSL